ncbi:MAG: hypothetical protein ACYSVY_16645 [Planctomycetota bacterium]|jgi:hypothetical protein
MPDVLRLQVHGPFGWLTGLDLPCVFDAPEIDGAGVYLWTVSFGTGELVYYVGESGLFTRRFREHLFAHLGGVYRIYDTNSLRSGRIERVWPGMWQKDGERSAGEFLSRRNELLPMVERQLRLMRLWLIPTDLPERHRKLVEAAIARTLREHPPPVGTFQEDDIRYARRTSDESPFRFSIEGYARFLGLPDMLAT